MVAFSVARRASPRRPAAPRPPPRTAPRRQSRRAPAPLPPALTSCPELATALRTVAANDARMRDWANLARYREANHSVGADRRRVHGRLDHRRVGPAALRRSSSPARSYTGRGISGQTTPQMLLRFRQDVINLKPKAVVILAGTNDIAGNTGPMTDEEIEGNLASMSELATNAGDQGGAHQHYPDQRLPPRQSQRRAADHPPARWRASGRSTTG